MRDETEYIIWLDDVHLISGRAAIIHDDGRCCWLYLHEFPNGPVMKSVLVYSPILPISRAEFDSTMFRGQAPMLICDYASHEAVIAERFSSDFSFRWRPDGEAVAVIYRERILAVVSHEKRHGSSAAIAQSGPFGEPLVLDHYDWL